ncbi:MAG: very short patch repair endonuclease [Caulobacteraceae bacterium]
MPEVAESPPDPPISDDRRELMSRVRQRDTGPELVVRRTLHALGFRYRLNVKGLPGSPDLVFHSRRLAVFVHGCFWHRHPHCRLTTTPKARAHFWAEKFEANQARDARDQAKLRESGWRVHVIWECETAASTWLAAFPKSLPRDAKLPE